MTPLIRVEGWDTPEMEGGGDLVHRWNTQLHGGAPSHQHQNIKHLISTKKMKEAREIISRDSWSGRAYSEMRLRGRGG